MLVRRVVPCGQVAGTGVAVRVDARVQSVVCAYAGAGRGEEIISATGFLLVLIFFSVVVAICFGC